MRCKAIDFFHPLGNDRLWYDYLGAGLWIPKHSCHELHGLTQTHFVTKKSTFGPRRLIFHCKHPENTFTLVGCEKPTTQGVLSMCVLVFNRHRMGLRLKVLELHR